MVARKQPVVDLSTGKEARRCVTNITVTRSERAGQVKVGRVVRMVYFSAVTGRWWFS